MLIHSVTPAPFLTEQPELPQMVCKKFGGGYFEGYDTPQGFQMARLCSTDPRLYLDKRYAPGQTLEQGGFRR